ncbi:MULTISPECIES: YciI family protein [Roseateles]|uniref:YciI family protein n=1 Tax=Roseateles flavus TaxID=3149041 RepID=A0ABV0GIX0_9BURK|nr:YciI family protein [Pelomonas sp. BJYL3]
MSYMLLILEPHGQRADRGRDAGEQVYERMLQFGAELQSRGQLLASQSLSGRSSRVQKRDGSLSITDGPFAESKELVGGFFLLDVPTREAALEIAARCPAAEWATIEVRGVGPCFEDAL